MTGRSLVPPLGLLTLLALGIWLRDPSWIDDAANTLPALAGLPLLVWLGWPWRLRTEGRPLAPRWLAASAVCLLVGFAADLCLPLAAGWTLLLGATLEARCQLDDPYWRRWLLLPLCAFPWIALDGVWLGWWFRLSGAVSADHLLTLLGFDVVREGTTLFAGGICVSVGAACSGLNSLQAMLVAGSLLALLQLGRHRRFWWHLPLLVVAVWIANTGRIVLTALVALKIDPRLARGTAHAGQGWLLLLLTFLACWSAFELLRRTGPEMEAAR